MAEVNYNRSGLIISLLIVLIILGSSFIVLSLTFLLWSPILFFNLPWIIVVSLLIRYTRLGNPAKNAYHAAYDWFFYKSEKPRQFLWQQLYDSLCWLYPQTRWKVMNYGYALLNDDGKLIPNLDAQDEEERFCLQLYHYIATSFNSVKNLNGYNVLEVGSGRGGGLNYVSTYLGAKECFGVDFSENQVKFCTQAYASNPNISFHHGNSENLVAVNALRDKKIDLVINIESSHCYGNFKEFVRQVDKILAPGGYFIITDFREKKDIEQFEADLTSFSLKIHKKEDISINVLHALKLDEKRRSNLIEKNVNFALKPFFRKFSGLQGTRKDRKSVV